MLDSYMTLLHQIVKRQCLAIQYARKLSPKTHTIGPLSTSVGKDSSFPKDLPQ